VPFAVFVGAFVATGVAAGMVQSLAPEPHGHWSGHLADAANDIGTIVVIAVGAALAWRALGDLGVKLLAYGALALVVLGLVMMTTGNLRVARSIWRTRWGDDEVGQFGSAYSGFESGHDLVDSGGLWVVIGGAAFALVLGFSRRVGVAAAVAGGIFAVIIPPWLFTGIAVMILLAVLLRPRPLRLPQ
jgi:hypothetical protein